jgi:hypothetical protein
MRKMPARAFLWEQWTNSGQLVIQLTAYDGRRWSSLSHQAGSDYTASSAGPIIPFFDLIEGQKEMQP